MNVLSAGQLRTQSGKANPRPETNSQFGLDRVDLGSTPAETLPKGYYKGAVSRVQSGEDPERLSCCAEILTGDPHYYRPVGDTGNYGDVIPRPC